MTKTVRARYTLECKQEAVRLLSAGQSIAAAGRSLGAAEQTLFNGVEATRQGRFKGTDGKGGATERMEIGRLQEGLSRLNEAGARDPGTGDGVVLPAQQ